MALQALKAAEGGIQFDNEFGERLVVEDNYAPEDMRGRELFVGVVEGVRGTGYFEHEAASALKRADAERLRDWLNAWLVRYE